MSCRVATRVWVGCLRPPKNSIGSVTISLTHRLTRLENLFDGRSNKRTRLLAVGALQISHSLFFSVTPHTPKRYTFHDLDNLATIAVLSSPDNAPLQHLTCPILYLDCSAIRLLSSNIESRVKITTCSKRRRC